MDAPEFKSVEELMAAAEDKLEWNNYRFTSHQILVTWRKHVSYYAPNSSPSKFQCAIREPMS